MARNKKVEILSNDKEVLHPMTDGDCVIFEDGQTLAQKLSEDDSVKYTPEIVNSSPMFKVGEGNTVDYSDNVLDGAYERATLQGQTYVNYIQESSADEVTLPTPFTEYERTQHNTLTSDEEGTLGINLVGQSYVNALQHDSEEEYVVLGESLEFQEKKVEYTNEGQIKSAMLKGQTLVNLATHKCFWNGYATAGEFLTQSLKNNTKYMIILNSIEGIQCVSLASNSWNIMQTLMGTEDNGSYKGDLSQKLVFTFKVGENDVDAVTNIRILLSSAPTSTPNYQVVLLEYQEGMENWDIPYFEGMQSVTVSTKLENLCQYADVENPKTGKTFNTSSSANRILTFMRRATTTLHFKPNTKYLVQFKISNLVLDGIPNITLILHGSTLSSGDCLFGEQGELQISSNNIYRAIFKTTDVVDTSEFVIKGGVGEWENSGSTLRSLTISEVMCVEYQNGMENWDLPYFEDYQVMKPVQVESVNKNLFDGQLESGNIDVATGDYATSTDRQRTVNFIPVKPNTTYILSNNREVTFGIREYDKNKNYLGWYTPLTNSDTLTALVVTKNSNVAFLKFIIVDTNTDNQIQLEESDTATEYVPHQSKTTYSWDEVILRKVGDVEDTLDLTTGEWVQRIGEIVLDGNSENWVVGSYTKIPFHIQGELPNNCARNLDSKKILSSYNKQIFENSSYGSVSATSYYRIRGIVFCPPENITTKEQAIEYIQANPIKVQYQLETPIIHKVNLSRPNLQVYDDITHVHTKCLDGTLIPNIYLPSDISYPAILEPSTTYNVCVNQTEVSADNPLTVNVGGTEITMTDSRMTLTTPTTLANSNVSFTGKGNKIKESMLIKNSSLLTGDLPHFNGIGSVQLGKTIENLCSSSEYGAGTAQTLYTLTNDSITVNIKAAGTRLFGFDLLKPLKNNKKYFIYAPQTYDDSLYKVSFKSSYNGSSAYSEQLKTLSKIGKAIIKIDQTDVPYSQIVVGIHTNISVNTTYTIQRPIICEYEPGMENWDWESIGYFTGTKNIGNEFMRVKNKNLFDGALELGSIGSNGKNYDYHATNANHKRSVNFTEVKGSTQYSVSNYNIQKPMVFEYDKNYNLLAHYNHLNNFTTKENTKYIRLRTHGNETGIIQLEESSTATTYTAHKHNGLYITKDQPIELTWEQGRINPSGVGDSYTNAINNAVSYGIRNKGLLNLKPNTTYRISLGDKANFKYHIAVFDNSDNALSVASSLSLSGDWVFSKDTIFTTTKDAHKIGINVQKQDASSITPSEINHIRLEEVTDVVLRGIGDVHDELDITRGIYTQRIGEVVFDGSEGGWNVTTTDGTPKAYVDGYVSAFRLLDRTYTATMVVDRYNKIPKIDTVSEGFVLNSPYFSDGNNILIRTERNKIGVNSFYNYLKSNPITIQYQLATPIVHKVHIGNKNEANTEVTKPNDVFTLPTLYTEQTHIDLTNNGIMPKVQSRDYIAYPVSPMINRTYTLQHNLTGGVSNLTIDLLGRTQSVSYQNHKSLVYTPETMDAILHHELRISGKGKISRVMYIDGGYMDRDIPYIEGMKNAVNPIVKNVGKNLFNIDDLYSDRATIIGENEFQATSVNLLTFIDIKVKPHTQYRISYEIYRSGGNTSGLAMCVHDGKNVGYYDSATRIFILTNVPSSYEKRTHIFTSKSDYISLSTLYGNYIKNLIITEMDAENNYEPYKENICYVDCGEIRLTPDMFEQGNFGSDTSKTYEENKNNGANRYRTKSLIKVEPNTTYEIRYTEYYSAVYEYGKDEKKLTLGYNINKSTLTITTSNNCYYLAFAFVTSTLPTQYISIIKVSEIKQMRSLPNGVYDEIDLETGTYVQRVGEVVLDGSANNFRLYTNADGNNTKMILILQDGVKNPTETDATLCICNGLPSKALWNNSQDYEGIWGQSSDKNDILRFRIFKSRLTSDDLNGVKQYLSQNPITVQYELAEPIVKDIVIHNYPHSYEGGHVIIESGDPSTPIPAQLTYRAVTNRSGQIQQHTEQVEKQEREINELETLILANIHLSQTR